MSRHVIYNIIILFVNKVTLFVIYYNLSIHLFQLERLQAENAAEWGKRERLETEKISLERENKQLRLKIHDLQERIESRRPRPVSTADVDTRQLQQELLVRNMVRIII